jgi:hypothetical protein
LVITVEAPAHAGAAVSVLCSGLMLQSAAPMPVQTKIMPQFHKKIREFLYDTGMFACVEEKGEQQAKEQQMFSTVALSSGPGSALESVVYVCCLFVPALQRHEKSNKNT